MQDITAGQVAEKMLDHVTGRWGDEPYDLITASRTAAEVLLGGLPGFRPHDEFEKLVIKVSELGINAVCDTIGVDPDAIDEQPAEVETIGKARDVLTRTVNRLLPSEQIEEYCPGLTIPVNDQVAVCGHRSAHYGHRVSQPAVYREYGPRLVDVGDGFFERMYGAGGSSWGMEGLLPMAYGFNHWQLSQLPPESDILWASPRVSLPGEISPDTLQRVRSLIKKIEADRVGGYTVQIQAGGDDDTIWQAMHPAENVTDPGPADQVALDVIANQNVLELDDAGPWRVAVWVGADADTSTEPVYTLDSQEFHDRRADALDRAEDDRQD